jgi:hypothetical protein
MYKFFLKLTGRHRGQISGYAMRARRANLIYGKFETAGLLSACNAVIMQFYASNAV